MTKQLNHNQSSRSLKNKEYAQAKQQGYLLQQIPIAIDGITFGVHLGLSVSGLTVNQLLADYLSLSKKMDK